MSEQNGGALPQRPVPTGRHVLPSADNPEPPGGAAARLVAGRYRLAEPIGSGAMGVVWRARDELLHREVAVKEVRLPPSLSDNSYQLTLREARTAARLSHPGVATVHDVVEESGRPWIVMELVHARSLDQILAEDGPLTPPQAADMGRQVLAALAAAHRAGVMHRDVKPSNVLITPDGRTVLTDFGIATFEGDASLTQSGIVMGSPGFLAPERIRGGVATPASDLWSLGATLYAAVEGQGPYDNLGGAITTMTAVVDDSPQPPKAAGPLLTVINALLSKDPLQRPSLAATRLMLESAIAANATDPNATLARAAGVPPVSAAPGTPPLTAVADAGSGGPPGEAKPSWPSVIAATMRLWLRRHFGRQAGPGRHVFRLASLALTLAVIGGLVIGLSSRTTSRTPSPARTASPGAPGDGAAAGAIRAQAATWAAQQINRSMIVACDPVMCQQLQAHGFAAGDLLVLTASTSDPLGSDVVIATSVIRNKFGSRLSGVYAPLVIASLGSGTARIDIRVTALDGTAAYLAAMRADRIARQAAGAQLLRNHRVAASASARQVIVAGSADARILITLATMAALHPVRVAAFGAAPGAGPQAPLRSVEITPAAALTPAAAIAQLDALRVFALAQRHPYLPALAEVDLLSGGTPVLRIEFGAPSPLGLLGAHPTP